MNIELFEYSIDNRYNEGVFMMLCRRGYLRLQKRWLFMISLIGMLALAACGGKPKTGVNEISYDELIKKLENEETFFLITTGASEENLNKTKGIESYDEALKKHGIGAYYVNLSEHDLDEVERLGINYLHSFMDNYGTDDQWDPERHGLIYVEKGGVVRLLGDISFSDKFNATRTEENLRKETHRSVKETLQKLDEYGFEYETE